MERKKIEGRKRISLVLVGALIAGGLLWGAMSTAARKDESLTVYSGRSEKLVAGLFKAFTRSTGVQVEVRYASTASLANQILEEGERSPADIFFAQDSGALGAVAEKGMFAALPDKILNKVPASFRSPQGEWVGLSGRARVLAYSTERLTKENLPTSIFELTDPKWKGRIGLPPTNASFQAFVTAMRVRIGDERTLAWLKGIVANEPKYYAKNTPVVKAVADGEIDLGLVNHYYLYRFIRKEGEKFPVRNYFLPGGDIGALINVAGVGILKSSKNQRLAERFIEYALSPAGQNFFVEGNNEYPVVDGVDIDPKRGLQKISSLQTPEVDLGKLSDVRGTVHLLQKAGMLPR